VTVMGRGVPVSWAEEGFRARARVDAHELYRLHSTWRGPYGALATAVLVNASGRSVAGAWADTTSVG
jgi:amidase